MSIFKTVGMIGLGYIGLPTAAILASRGLSVVGVDVNRNTVDTINAGKVHIVEPDLDIVVKSAVTMGKLRASTVPEPADAFLIAVPTPFKDEHKPDLSYIKNAADSIGPVLEKGNLVILESTSPVGTTEKLSQWLAEARPELKFPHNCGENADVQIAHCPERVLPGHVLSELVNNDRIIGGLSEKCVERATELYQVFVKGDCISSNARTAELCKLTENAFRDVNIGFANELSMICDSTDIDVWELISLANRHPRVNILQPGPGVGGHCIAVDPWFIVDSVPEYARIIKTARLVNDAKPEFFIEKVRITADRFKDPKIAVFGLAFKADIDDLRESPALEITKKILEMSLGKVYVVEPNIDKLPESIASFPNVELVSNEVAVSSADIILGLVDHREFKKMDTKKFNEKIVHDSRGMWRLA
jgi:UDP-N-acetyl-D-mannosaminuronic acid dehydrogenase